MEGAASHEYVVPLGGDGHMTAFVWDASGMRALPAIADTPASKRMIGAAAAAAVLGLRLRGLFFFSVAAGAASAGTLAGAAGPATAPC